MAGMFAATDGVGIFTIKPKEYARFLAIMEDAHTIPRDFKEWQKEFSEALAFIESEGGKPVIVEFDANQFAEWCLARGMALNAASRNAFVADPANWPARHKH